jgi:hypothetical protein
MTAWRRRNRWYLVALAVLIPGALLVSLLPRFLPYLGSLTQYQDVALGETVRYSGADIQLTDLMVLDGDEIAAPLGADVVVATFVVDVVEPPESARCEFVVVSDEGGVERRWDAEAYLDSDYEVPEGVEQFCTLSEAGRYDLQVTFPVPHGQVADPVIELSSSAAHPLVLRLH